MDCTSNCLSKVQYQLLLRDELIKARKYGRKVLTTNQKKAANLVASRIRLIIENELAKERKAWQAAFELAMETPPMPYGDGEDLEDLLSLIALPYRFVLRVIRLSLAADESGRITGYSKVAKEIRDTPEGQKIFMAYLASIWGYHRTEFVTAQIQKFMKACPNCQTRVGEKVAGGPYNLFCVCLPEHFTPSPGHGRSPANAVEAVCDGDWKLLKIIANKGSLEAFISHRISNINNETWESANTNTSLSTFSPSVDPVFRTTAGY